MGNEKNSYNCVIVKLKKGFSVAPFFKFWVLFFSMKCPSCDHISVEDTAKFCSQCGTKLITQSSEKTQGRLIHTAIIHVFVFHTHDFHIVLL